MKITIPKAKHFIHSNASKKDEVMDIFETKAFLSDRLVYQEKMDGYQISAEFLADGTLCFKHASKALPNGGRTTTIKKWFNVHEAMLLTYLETNLILIGEWMKDRQESFYNALPSFFIITDVYDKEMQMFWSTEKVKRLSTLVNVPAAPIINEGVYAVEDIMRWVKRPSAYGLEQIEGVYARLDDDHRTIARGQFIGEHTKSKIKNKYNIIKDACE